MRSRDANASAPRQRLARFGVFEFDLTELKLLRKGRNVDLQQQPAVLLSILLRRAGSVVTRAELRETIWSSDTYVEFEFGLNTIVNRLRRVLGDTAAEPRFIETVPKQGYRFIAPVEFVLPVPDAGLSLVGASSDAPQSAEPEQEQPPVAPPSPHRHRLAVPISLALFAAALAGLAGLRWLRPLPPHTPEAGAVVRSYIALPPGHIPEVVVISPGGEQIVYQVLRGGVRQLYRRVLSRRESTPIEGSAQGTQPFFSPDGQQIGFFGPSSIRICGPAGIRDVVAIPPEFDLRKAMWGEDGFIYYTTATQGIWRVSSTGGQPQLALRPSPSAGSPFYFPQQLLNSNPPLLLLSTNHGPTDRAIALAKLFASEPPKTLLQHAMGGQLLASGQLLYFWRGKLLAAPFNAEAHELAGSGLEVLSDVDDNGWRGPNASVSQTGTLTYIEAEQERRSLVWIDAKGRQAPLPVPPAAYEQAEVSPDGTRIGISRQDLPGVWTLWIFNLRTGAWTHLIDSDVPYPRMVWSPDGKSAIVSAVQGDEQMVNLYKISPASPGRLERLTDQPAYGQFPGSWSASADTVLFTEGVHTATQSDILALPLSNPLHPRVLIASKGSDRTPAFSPDGRWFAYASAAGPGMQVFAQPLDQSLPPLQISREGGTDPAWAPGGDSIYFLDPKRALMQVHWRPGTLVGLPRQLFPAGFARPRDWWTRAYSIAPDGRFLVIRDPERPVDAISRIQVIVNWVQEIKRLAPVDPAR